MRVTLAIAEKHPSLKTMAPEGNAGRCRRQPREAGHQNASVPQQERYTMKLFKKVMAAAALAAAACSPAHAIDRIGWSKTRETMYVHGEFELGDAKRIYTAIQANRQTLRGIIFNSPGGLVWEGYLLSRLIEGK